MDRFLKYVVTPILAVVGLALVVISLIDIEGPGARDFFSRHRVFRVVYVLTHFVSGDGLFYVHIGPDDL